VGVGSGADAEAEAEGKADAEAGKLCVGVGDGFAEVGEADGAPAVAGSVAAGVVLLGDGPAVAAALAVKPGLPGALGLADLLVVREASSVCGACVPPRARTAISPAQATATTTPAAAAIRDTTTIRGRGCLITSGKPLSPNGPAFCVTSCRYARVCSPSSAHSLSTSSRSQIGSAASGAMPNNAAGRIAPRLRSSQTSH
jgi:hypothetical protein